MKMNNYRPFDECPEIDDNVETIQHHLSLHFLPINQRGDGSTFVPGRVFLYANTEFQFSQLLRRPVLGKPPIP